MGSGLKAEKERQGILDQIILGIAHELNNPNTFIRVNAANLKKMFWLLRPCLDEYAENHPDAKLGPYPTAEFRARFSQHLESILEATVRIIVIADKLKQCTSDSLEQSSTVCMREIVQDMLQTHRFLLEGALRVEVQMDEARAYPVPGHRLQLEQAVSVLLGNARDAIVQRHGPGGAEAGRLSVVLEEGPETIRLRVSDNGEGMDAETLEKVFVPYFTTKPQGEGDGLGLAICKAVVTRHGGSVRVESEKGRGTDVFVELPKREE